MNIRQQGRTENRIYLGFIDVELHPIRTKHG
jgi:hypothetical protein